MIRKVINESPETNIEQLFYRWLQETSKQTKSSPKMIATAIFNYLKRDFKLK